MSARTLANAILGVKVICPHCKTEQPYVWLRIGKQDRAYDIKNGLPILSVAFACYNYGGETTFWCSNSFCLKDYENAELLELIKELDPEVWRINKYG